MQGSKRLLRRILIAAFALQAMSHMYAQLNRGQIRGTATDPQGAVVPEVRVVVTNTATNEANHVTTNSAGFYLVPDLLPGTYTVQFQAAGFAKLEIASVQVQAGSTVTVDGPMKLGQSAETVNGSVAKAG